MPDKGSQEDEIKTNPLLSELLFGSEYNKNAARLQ
jgi:hypothetical protein